MIAVFWKELRENLRWAFPACVAMAAALISLWQAAPLVFDSGPGSVGNTYLWTGMIAMFTAIALGILQARRDKRPASRALLLHRGITADAAFAGKLLAGLALYSFAIFIPLLAMALFIAINGIEHKAASVMSLMPMALVALATFGFWPASLLMVQRDARSFGSRLTPALPALVAVFLCLASWNTTGEWLVFSLISLLHLFVLLLAARSVFADSGQIATGIGRAALAPTVSMAFVVMFLFVASTVESYRRAGAAAVNCFYAVQFGPEGQPWLGRQDYSQQDGSYELTQAAKMAVARSARDELQPVAEDWKTPPLWKIDLHSYHYVRGYWARFTQIASASPSSSAEFVQRRWVFDHRGDVILVYHRTLPGQWQLARRLSAPEPVGSFGEVRRHGQSDLEGNFTLVTSTGAFYVPGDGSAVVTMYQAPASSAILDSVEHPQRKDEPFTMMLRLADRIVLLEGDLDETGASRATPIGEVGSIGRLFATEIQLPAELAEPKSLSIARDPQGEGTFLGLAQSWDSSECPIVWVRFDARGQIAAQQEYTENTGSDLVDSDSVFVALIPPGVWATFMIGFVATDGDYSIAKAWTKAWEYTEEDPARAARAVLVFFLPSILGVPLAIWAARRRRLDRRQTWIWIAWGFAMGPAGSLSILAVYPRIVRERCISCRKPTRIDLQQCEHCSHRLDDMPRIGIEIFGRDALAASKQTETIGSC